MKMKLPKVIMNNRAAMRKLARLIQKHNTNVPMTRDGEELIFPLGENVIGFINVNTGRYRITK